MPPQVHEVYVDGNPYSGSLTGLAASADDLVRSVWACSRHADHLPWQILRFDYHAVMQTDDAIVHATIVQRGGLGWLDAAKAKRCTLTHAPGMNLDPDYLWVGAVVEKTMSDDDGGQARAYKVMPRDEFADIYTSQGNTNGQQMYAPQYGELLVECDEQFFANMGGCASENVGGPYYNARLIYGERVQGFAFFENKFDVPHVAIARCEFSSNQPCALEFHFLVDSEWELDTPVPYPYTLRQPSESPNGGHHLVEFVGGELREKCNRATATGCTLAMAFKIPPGIGSLAHDSSLRAIPHQYFHLGFIGTTTEHLNQTRKRKADPEDRIFLMRAPILQSQRPTVTRNWIQARVLGSDLFEPGVLMRFENEDGSVQPAVAENPDDDSEWDGEMMDELSYDMSYDERSTIIAEGNAAEDGDDGRRRSRRRQLSQDVGGSTGLRSALGDLRGSDAAHLLFGGGSGGRTGGKMRGGGGTPPHALREGRRLSDEDDGCFQASTNLMEPYVWKPFLKNKGLPNEKDGFVTTPCLPLWPAPPLLLCGSITAHVIITLNIAGEICLAKKSLSVSLIPAVTVKVLAAIYVDLLVVRGGLTVNANLLTLQVWLKALPPWTPLCTPPWTLPSLGAPL